MSDLSDLANFMDDLATKVHGAANNISKKVALAIIENLTPLTPADVGTAVSNWQVSFDSPTLAIISAYEPSARGRTVKGKWTHTVPPATTIAANSAAAIEAAMSMLEMKMPGQTIYIFNALPYIQRLNEGWSEQAPAGFVDRAVIVGKSIVESINVLE